MSNRLVASVLETFIRKTRWSGRTTPYWVGAFWISALPFLISGRTFRLETEIRGKRVTALCVGRSKRFRELAKRIFNGAELQPTSRRRVLWRLNDLPCAGADLIVMETHPWLAGRLRRRGWIIMPESVRWRGRPAEMPPDPPGNSLSEDLRKIRRRDYTLETSASRDAWTQFLQEIATPYARYRHGEDAWIPTEAFTRPLARARSQILFVRHHDRRVAACCVLLRDNEAWVPLLGVREGDFKLLKKGALAALYSFLIAWVRSQGIEVLDFGRTSSFCHNGLAFYKAKWGFRPKMEPLSPLVAMRFCSDHSDLRTVFETEPVYILDGNNLGVFDGTDTSLRCTYSA